MSPEKMYKYARDYDSLDANHRKQAQQVPPVALPQQDEALTPEQVADRLGVTRYSDMRPFVVQAVKYTREQDASLSKQEPDGWKLVPIEPTRKMIAAGSWATNEKSEVGVTGAENAYRKMIEVAPKYNKV